MKCLLSVCIAIAICFASLVNGAAPPELPGLPGLNRPAAPPSSAAQLVEVRLLADTDTIAPGSVFHLAVSFKIASGWHIYWEYPGSAGSPTEFEVRVPKGFTVGAPRYPRPHELVEPDGTVYGYEKETVIFIPVTAPDVLGDVPPVFEVDVFYLVCRGMCLIGRESRRIELTASAARAEPRSEPADARLARFWRQLPRPLDALPGAKAKLIGGALVITGPTADARKVAFFPVDTSVAWFDPPTVVADDRAFRIDVPVDLRWQNAETGTTTLRGILAFGDHSDPSYQVELPVAAPESGP